MSCPANLPREKLPDGLIAAEGLPLLDSFERGRVPSLDGLRALSIGLVLVGHGGPAWLHPIIGNGGLGVTVFFVLSGFLITTLLVREIRKTGGISISAFYVRRAFRIWPAFYLLVAFVGLLGIFKVIHLDPGELISASLFFWNYRPYHVTALLGHTWSLAVEEQFYLIWPLLLGWAGTQGAAWLAGTIILLEPGIRLATYFLVPSMRGHIAIMGHTRADALMIGALAALLYRNEQFESLRRKLFAKDLPLLGAIFVLFVDPSLEQRWRGAYLMSIGYTLQNVCIVFAMLWVIQNPSRFIGRIFNSRAIVHIGQISFSLYLWQQIFMTQENKTVTGSFPLNLVLIIIVAECSYWFVEKPFLGWRKRFVADA